LLEIPKAESTTDLQVSFLILDFGNNDFWCKMDNPQGTLLFIKLIVGSLEARRRKFR